MRRTMRGSRSSARSPMYSVSSVTSPCRSSSAQAGIKDYGHLFLTHGGMLDRFDSTMFIAPVVYFFVAGGIL